MNKINKTALFSYTIYFCLALALGALGAWAFYRPSTMIRTGVQARNAQPIAQAVVVLPQPTAIPALVVAGKKFIPQTVVANGVPVQLNYVRSLAPGEYDLQKGIEIGFCYPTRNAGQWYSSFAPIYNNGKKIIPWAGGWQKENTSQANSEKPGRECGLVVYELDPATIQYPLQFTISTIYVQQREWSFCNELKQRLETSAEAKRVGLAAQCEDQADGSYQTRVVSHLPSVSDDEAQQVLNAEIASEYIGPWTFSIDAISE